MVRVRGGELSVSGPGGPESPAGSPGPPDPDGDARPGLSGADRRRAQKNLARIERRLDRAGQAVDALHGRLEAVSADPTRADELAGLGRQLAAAQTSRAELETQWLEAAEVLEP